MRECDTSKIYISSNFLLSICLLIFTLQHFATLHQTTLHYIHRHYVGSLITSILPGSEQGIIACPLQQWLRERPPQCYVTCTVPVFCTDNEN